MTIDNDFYDFKNRRAIRPHPPPLRQGWESDETAPLEVVMETTQSSPVKAGETFQNLRLAPMPLIHQYLLRRQELLNRWSWFRPFQIGRPFLGGDFVLFHSWLPGMIEVTAPLRHGRIEGARHPTARIGINNYGRVAYSARSSSGALRG